MKLNRTKLFQYGLTAAVLTGVAIAGVKYLSGGEIVSALRRFQYAYMPFMLLLSTAYILVKGWRFVVLVRPVATISRRLLMRLFVAGQPATLVPGGVAARAILMNQAGIPIGNSASPVAFASLIDQSFFVVSALIAAFWLPQARIPAAILSGIVSVVAILFAIRVTRRRMRAIADWVAKKVKADEQWQSFLHASGDLLSLRPLGYAFGITILSYVFMVIILDLALRGVGVDVADHKLFLALVIPTMLGRLVPVPAGVGVTEASMVGFLTSTAGVGLNTAAAAVAVFRVSTILWQALVGAVVYFVAWKGNKEDATADASSSATVKPQPAD